MLNKIFEQGRLVSDPVLRRTGGGVAVASFTIAVEDDFTDKDGNKKTIFLDCVAWRGLGEMVVRNFTKGRMIMVVGKLDIRDWTDKDGNKRKSAEIVVDNVYFCDSKRDNENSGMTATYGDTNGANVTYSPSLASDFAMLDDQDGTLPF